jgi:anion-transporting  ArsA/GET3 family ATPase
MQEIIDKHKVIICIGTGGVGKTTLSSSIGVKAAQSGKKVLILTIDPARRLAQALGIEKSNKISKVQLDNCEGELHAGMLLAEETFKKYIYNSVKDKESANRIFKNKLYKQLSSKLSGSQEFTSMLELLDHHQSKKYDLIILDTPPSQHAVDFLKAPQKIYNLFQSNITKWFTESENKNSVLVKIFQKSTRMVLSAFERVTGEDFINELADFFSSLNVLQESIQKNSFESNELLHSGDTAFILISSNDPGKVQEAKRLYEKLEQQKYRINALIVNQAYPNWIKNSDQIEQKLSQESDNVQMHYEKMKEYYGLRAQSYAKFKHSFAKDFKFIQIPELTEDLSGKEGLEFLSQYL